jgi:hypothetical protein
VNPADWHFLTGTPYLVRMESGLLKPGRRVNAYQHVVVRDENAKY